MEVVERQEPAYRLRPTLQWLVESYEGLPMDGGAAFWNATMDSDAEPGCAPSWAVQAAQGQHQAR